MSEMYWSENLIIWGAGATAELGMPVTSGQEAFLTTLFNKKENDSIEERVKKAFDIEGEKLQEVIKIIKFFEENEDFDGISPDLRKEYDWNTLQKVIECCPKSGDTISMVDLYGILDSYLSENRGVSLNGKFISYHQLLDAKHLVILLVQLYFYCKYQEMLDKKKNILKQYYDFYKVLATEMLEKGYHSFDNVKINHREYYLFDYSITSLNWDPILLWLIFNVHKDLNDKNGYYVDSPARKLKLFNDFATFLGTRSIDEELDIWYPFNEAVVQRINNPSSLTDKRVRVGKFYFPHGSSSWRECPHCGKLMMYMGEEWGYESASLISPLPFKYFSSNFIPKTDYEKKWRANREYDAMQCIFCGSKTTFKDTTLLIQSAFKGRNTSFVEEIQRDMRIAFEKANHIIFMGYSLPNDDISYRSMLASRCQHKGEPLKVSVILYDNEAKSDWYEGEELEQYIEDYPNIEGGSSLKRIKEVLGDDIKLRAYLGGVPSVFLDTNGEVSKEKVLNLIYWK